MKIITRLIALWAAALLLPLWAGAQTLTSAQRTTLRTAICADTGTARPAMLAGDASAVRAWLNGASSFIVYKTSVTVTQIGDAINGTELAGLSSLNNTRLQTVVMMSSQGVNPSLADRRQFFADIFSGAGGTTTRANLDALWRRSATNAEKALATGTGTTASPGLLVFEGLIGEAVSVGLVYQPNGTLYGC